MTAGFEHFELIRPLGEGGEANVYLVRDPATKHLVALRVLKEKHESMASAFLQRARMLAGLGHPGIVRVLESSREGELPAYVALSYASNGTLGDKLRDGAFHELKDSICLLIKVAEACHFAHQHGVLHGDISPANILFDERNEPILADFGGGPVPGEVGGFHPNFSAPEKIAGGADTVAADVFSLGAVLALLALRCPKRTLQKKRVLRVVEAATAIAPSQRYVSAQEFTQELRRVLADEPLERSPAWVGERLLLQTRRHRKPIVMALVAMLLLVGAEAGMLTFFRYREQEQATASLKTYRELAIEYSDHVRLHLQALSEIAHRAARDPELIAYLAAPVEVKPRAAFAHYYEASQLRGGNTMSLFDRDGNLMVHYPSSGAIEHKNFAFRDYYEGIRALVPNTAFTPESRDVVYVSRAYRGEDSCGVEFSFTVPVLNADSAMLGFILLSVQAQHTFGRIGVSRLDGHNGGRVQSALFAERSRDRPGKTSCGRHDPVVGRFIALVHPDLFRAEEHPANVELSQMLDGLTYRGEPANQLEAWERDPLVLESFIDPVAHTAQMGAFAPVGRTRIAVGVFADAHQLGPWHSLPPSMLAWGVVGNLAFLVAGLWAAARGRG